MEKDYISIMQKKENLCRAYLRKADYEYAEKGRHTKDEGRYLQEASKLQFEMAQLSDGEARQHHLRRQKEIDAKIVEIAREVSPDVYQRILHENESKKRGDSRDGSASSKSKQEKSGKKAAKGPSEETVESWFKPMPSHSFAEVSGMTALKEQLRGCIEDARLNAIRKYLKMPQLHSFFFIGPPGCGKTYIIEAFAHELMQKDYKYLSLDGSDILSRYVGDAEATISRLFEEAENNAPCIVFVDEIDGVCRNRSEADLPVWAASLTTSFLIGYNRINSSDKPIIFIGATNYPNKVDNAMMDRVQLIRVPYPDLDAREHAFRMQFESVVELEPGFSFRDMAEVSDQYNYRDIDRLSDLVKNRVLKEVLELYPDENQAIEMMQNKNYFLTREMFEAARSEYNPTPKDMINRELDEWEARFQKNKEQDG